MTDDTTGTSRLLLVVADGVRPDVLAEELAQGNLPAMARLREKGGLYTVSTSFPSVTGPAYAPFVMGRHPAAVGMPGLRWFDRARSLRWSYAQARSYSGIDIWHVDGDLDPAIPTLYDLVTPSLAGLMMIARGATHGRVGRGIGWSLRAGWAHFRGDAGAWRRVEQAAVHEFFRRFRRTRPLLSALGILGPDKLSHAFGGESPIVRSAIRDVDAAIAQAQAIAAEDGWSEGLRVWVVGDHGHAPVDQHDDLHAWLSGRGHRVLAHPQLGWRDADVALMVGGNAMGHLYLDPAQTTRSWWPSLRMRWQRVLDALLERPSTGLLAVAMDSHTVRVFTGRDGVADIIRTHEGREARWSYRPLEGDPLHLGGSLPHLDAHDAWLAGSSTPYADALVQLSTLVPSPRAGDIVLSAAVGWDLRARFEPTPHVSTHGALLNNQMLVPLLIDGPVTRIPQRTTDVVPSVLDLLGVPTDLLFDGRSFIR